MILKFWRSHQTVSFLMSIFYALMDNFNFHLIDYKIQPMKKLYNSQTHVDYVAVIFVIDPHRFKLFVQWLCSGPYTTLF